MTATFDNHQHTTNWSDADSRALDDWARSHQARTPLQRDPHLYKLLVQHCATCHNPMRPSNRSAGEFPGTIPKGNRDICQKCYQLKNPKKRTP